MPSFPDSVFAPANRSAGQTIDASHVNSLQDEVVALEGGYLNGTARLNSSNSTVANLSVTGGTTLASFTVSGTLQSSNSTVNALSVSSNSTFAYRPTMPPPDGARVHLASVFDIGSTASTVTFTAQTFATNSSVHSTGTNPERLTPQSTGIYLFHAGAVTVASPGGTDALYLRLAIRDSSNAVIAMQDIQSSANNAQLIGMNVSGIKRFDALGGYVTVSIGNVAVGSTMSLSSGAANTWFSMVKF